MKEWHFFDKIYRRWIVLQIGPIEELRSELESDGYAHMDFIIDAKGYTILMDSENNTRGHRCFIVYLKEYETSTLVHELTHLTMQVFEQIGIPISMDNTEAFAFYTEYWFNEMQRARRRYPNGRESTQVIK